MVFGSAVGQNHRQEPDLPNLMAKPVDKARRIRYNSYGILIYLAYLIIPRMAGSSEPAFLFSGIKSGAVAPVDYSSTFATAPYIFIRYIEY